MAVTPTYPGVYVQEVPSGVRSIAGVGTSTAIFLGRAPRGRLGEPVRCLSYTAFDNEFSSRFAPFASSSTTAEPSAGLSVSPTVRRSRR
jgi:phage tail sheath protein FI